MCKECIFFYCFIVEKGGSFCYVFNVGIYEVGELVVEGIVDGKVVVIYSVCILE